MYMNYWPFIRCLMSSILELKYLGNLHLCILLFHFANHFVMRWRESIKKLSRTDHFMRSFGRFIIIYILQWLLHMDVVTRTMYEFTTNSVSLQMRKVYRSNNYSKIVSKTKYGTYVKKITHYTYLLFFKIFLFYS